MTFILGLCTPTELLVRYDMAYYDEKMKYVEPGHKAAIIKTKDSFYVCGHTGFIQGDFFRQLQHFSRQLNTVDAIGALTMCVDSEIPFSSKHDYPSLENAVSQLSKNRGYLPWNLRENHLLIGTIEDQTPYFRIIKPLGRYKSNRKYSAMAVGSGSNDQFEEELTQYTPLPLQDACDYSGVCLQKQTSTHPELIGDSILYASGVQQFRYELITPLSKKDLQRYIVREQRINKKYALYKPEFQQIGFF